jgi:hypothetical protein
MLPGEDEYLVATVDESCGLGPVLVPLVKPALKRLAYATVTAMDTGVGPLRVFVPLDLGITCLGESPRAAPRAMPPCPCRRRLRKRPLTISTFSCDIALLQQPHGFEGLGPAAK